MTGHRKWAVGALGALVVMGIVLPVAAQRAGGRESDDVNHAKEIVALIKQGQLALTDATEIAEKHIKGNALSATCEVRSSGSSARGTEKRGHPSAAERQPAGKRLVYDITCFAKEKVHVVQVDGLSREVVRP